jgi:hypothetical protein
VLIIFLPSTSCLPSCLLPSRYGCSSYNLRNWGTEVGIATRLRAGGSGVRIPVKVQDFLFLQTFHPYLLCDLVSLVFHGYHGYFPGESGRGVKLNIQFHLVSSLRMSGFFLDSSGQWRDKAFQQATTTFFQSTPQQPSSKVLTYSSSIIYSPNPMLHNLCWNYISYEPVKICITRPTALQSALIKSYDWMASISVELFTFLGCCARQVCLLPTFRDSVSGRFPRVKRSGTV